VLTTAVSMILSSLFPRFRDIGIIWSVLATALFYATPVLYPLDAVSAKVRDVISLNPLARAPIFAAGAEVGDRSARPRPGAARGRLAQAARARSALRRDRRGGGVGLQS